MLNRSVRCAILFFLLVGATAFAASNHLIFWNGNYASAREAASTLHKPILLYFTDDNPYARQFDSVVFRNPDVTYFVGHTSIPFRVLDDGIDSEVTTLLKKFRVKDFPTAILVNAAGNEIDRMVGYQNPREFLVYYQNFLNDTNTIGNLRKRLHADTANLAVAFQLALRYELRTEVDSAMWLMQAIAVRGAAQSLVVQLCKLHLAVYESRTAAQTKRLTEFYFTTPIDSLKRGAAMELLGFYDRHKVRDSLLATFERITAQWPNDAGLMNDFAWFLTLPPKADLQRAATLADRAIKRDPKNAEFYDTRAEVYAQQKKYSAAIDCMDKALKLRPHDANLETRRELFRDDLKNIPSK